ncbi:MAG: molybdopterin-dependent oxidoreductase [Lachnospiraceae bacterium]|nr:molybdopterin-dependent oxidoreductase [Lachnospiraceae bacterium]
MSKEYSVLGKSEIKVDSLEKVLGTAKYAGDYDMPGMLYGGVFRSTVPHAYIKKLNLEKARKMPGVACVLDHTAIPGINRFGIIIKDEPCLVDDKVRRYGDAIAVVAAETKEILAEALEAIEVEYEEIEPIFTIERALEEDSPKIHGDSNIHATKHLEHGDVDGAFEKFDVIVEHEYSTHRLSHMFIEPDAGVAYIDENGMLTVVASTQNPHYDRGEVAKMLGVPTNRVRVKQATTGGGFGGKLDIGVQLHCALLTYYTKKPVKIVRGRKESTTVSSKRHPMVMKAKTGATKDGKILVTDIFQYGDTGAYASYGPAVIGRSPVHAAGPYDVPNVRVHAVFTYTNNPMSGAFRGFGVPQAAVVHEGQMNAIAEKLNMSQFDIRMINAQTVGCTLPTGQKLTESVGFKDTLTLAMEKAREVMDFSEGEL